jgi:retron-type reverse transcriptase
MSLATPAETVETLQTSLQAKAKAEPDFRFYSLWDKVCRKDVLQEAYRRCHANAGAAGVDRVSFARIEAQGAERWLERLREELTSGQYAPKPLLRMWIAKSNGGRRPLGIPCISDRVVGMAALLVIGPIFEADLLPQQYGFRPGLDAKMALRRVYWHVTQHGRREVVDADLRDYFTSIPHSPLMRSLSRRIADGRLLHTIKGWLTAPVVEIIDGRAVQTTEARRTKRGVPQGGVISPLAANLYFRRFLLAWHGHGHRDQLDAHVVNYADDVRHITWRWIPFAERRGLEEMTLGPAAHLAARAKGNSSMPSKRERPEDAYGPVPQGPRDMVRTALFEPQPPAMQAYIPRHSVSCRGHRDRTAKSSSSEPSTRWAMGDHPIQGGGRGTYVALDTSSIKGMWDRPPRREAQGDGAAVVLRGRESRPHGEGRQVS